jgi:5-methylcytosine-specific restriction endonuclease McrA
MRLSKKQYREMTKSWAIAYLGGKCVSCGDTEDLEFDHIDPTTKSFSIGWSLNRTKKYLEPELKKCQLLCAMCHAIKTSKQMKTAKHGTRSMYNNGCKCKECRHANASYEYRRKH